MRIVSTYYLKVSVILGVVFSLNSLLLAQSFYSTNPDYIKQKNAQAPLLRKFISAYPDTATLSAPFYSPINTNGSTGLSSVPYFFQASSYNLGYTFLRPFLEHERILASQVNYYRTAGPFASLTGIAGAGDLQMFRMLFSHNSKRSPNISVRLNRYISKGFYKRQESNITNFYVSSNYETKGSRVGYYFYILNNSNKNSENGGLQTSLTNETVLDLKGLQAVNLSIASREDRETKINLQPYLRLSKKADSTQAYEHLFQLQSEFSASSFRFTNAYNDTINPEKFFRNIYLDSTHTRDSAHIRQFSNALSYVMRSKSADKFLSLGYRNEINQVWQLSSRVRINHLAEAQVAYVKDWKSKDSAHAKTRQFNVSGLAQSVIGGYNVGDVLYKGEVNFQPNTSTRTRVFASASFENRKPDEMYLQWQSNNFFWENIFRQQQKFELNVGTHIGQWLGLSVFQQNIHNFLYFDTLAHAQQHIGMVLNTGIRLNLAHVFFRHLGVGIEQRMQLSNKTEIQRFPSQYSKVNLYYTGSLFKNALQLNIGAQVQVFQGFTPYAYMPSTQMYYLQNTANGGAYPYLDLYLSGRIRPVTFFIKIENVLRELGGINYYLVSGNYQPERAFRMGLTWLFFD